MEIGSLSTALASSYSNSNVQSARQQSPAETQQVEQREPRPENQEANREQAARPITNTDGQRTGTVINVTA